MTITKEQKEYALETARNINAPKYKEMKEFLDAVFEENERLKENKTDDEHWAWVDELQDHEKTNS